MHRLWFGLVPMSFFRFHNIVFNFTIEKLRVVVFFIPSSRDTNERVVTPDE